MTDNTLAARRGAFSLALLAASVAVLTGCTAAESFDYSAQPQGFDAGSSVRLAIPDDARAALPFTEDQQLVDAFTVRGVEVDGGRCAIEVDVEYTERGREEIIAPLYGQAEADADLQAGLDQIDDRLSSMFDRRDAEDVLYLDVNARFQKHLDEVIEQREFNAETFTYTHDRPDPVEVEQELLSRLAHVLSNWIDPEAVEGGDAQAIVDAAVAVVEGGVQESLKTSAAAPAAENAYHRLFLGSEGYVLVEEEYSVHDAAVLADGVPEQGVFAEADDVTRFTHVVACSPSAHRADTPGAIDLHHLAMSEEGIDVVAEASLVTMSSSEVGVEGVVYGLTRDANGDWIEG
ncbi:hypothetical protein PTQ19_12005 [Microbacterium esteraromaticum]|uniref:hypothetical protein n=1 Tax=Microbacterium esteraromaticum TaxID=57043 RepID=UPI002367CBC4|nr:hypothetical protein [Microbacterium esteraromaticum]WDH78234.1 hypothetical protein PTQ19_12005 [Microbacterium esteraromaticum]